MTEGEKIVALETLLAEAMTTLEEIAKARMDAIRVSGLALATLTEINAQLFDGWDEEKAFPRND